MINYTHPLKIGQRCQTPLGLATIIGFEGFNARGSSLPLSDVDTGGRAAVRLDEPGNWLSSAAGHVPYIWRSQLQAVSK